MSMELSENRQTTASGHDPLATRLLVMTYSVVSYAIGTSALLALILWMGGVLPAGLPVIAQGPAFDSPLAALLWNALWVVGFGYKHTSMARPRFKNWYSRHFPAATVRSSYVLATGVYLLPMLYFWSPMPAVVWASEGALSGLLLAVFALGWGILFAATFTIDHFELFGLRQAWQFLRQQPLTAPKFVQRGLYRYIRHPIMTGMLIGIWSLPVMTVEKLVMAFALTAYVFIGLIFEERALRRTLGEQYGEYCQQVGRLLPKFGRKVAG
ncbi:isoprenylcysteine carboxylmethyltransferase family protein [Microbulbifer bruguierae]|uniref:Isoprenylcysteine carboxylmethyltransferase family protein n=1 Tax=Microbulbifer bruguierae TaxID=3029061 RepID=A0ABY8NAN2_9GAMM|nr:isoprenylcysteine carboxylmethyltransferase family protein [Microbulbifer bruguierae]WGL15868.1 isoprenylcysteine carboxylmethyltransferase family protein [Microbulbifer bruguierae]